MRKTTGTMMVTAMLAQASAASAQFQMPPPPPAPRSMPGNPMQPSSKWAANFGDNSCEIARDFDTGKQQVELVFRPLTGTDQIQVELRYRGAPPKPLGGNARFAMYPAGSSATGGYFDAALPPEEPFERLTMITLQRKDVAELAHSQVITLVYGSKMASLAPGVLGDVAKVLKECEDDLVKSWGYDPKLMSSLMAAPTPVSPEKWFSARDLPSKRDARDVRPPSVRFTVGADGVVSNCALVFSSGSKMFDDRACALMTTRARYKPALDAAGQPVAALMVSPVLRPFGS